MMLSWPLLPTFGFSTKRCTWPYSSITTTPYLLGSSTCARAWVHGCHMATAHGALTPQLRQACCGAPRARSAVPHALHLVGAEAAEAAQRNGVHACMCAMHACSACTHLGDQDGGLSVARLVEVQHLLQRVVADDVTAGQHAASIGTGVGIGSRGKV